MIAKTRAKSRKSNLGYNIIYGVMAALFIGMIICLGIRPGSSSMAQQLFSSAETFDSGWTLESGEEVNISKLQTIEGIKPYEQFSIYNTIPEDLGEGISLYFRTKNIFYSVYVDGKLIYEPYVPESRMYTKSMGTRWNCIELPQKYSGKQLEIKITTVYTDARSSIDNVYLGNSGGLILQTVEDRLVAFITCVLLLFVGLLLVVADIPINMQPNKNHELMYLGLFSISIAVWCLAETNLIQFYVDDSRVMQLISCTSLMMIPIPLVLYLKSAFGFKYKWLVPLVCGLSAADFLICWTMHFMNIADIHENLRFTHVVLAICASILLVTIVKNTFVRGKSKTRNVYRILRSVGLSCLSIATAIDIVRFYRGSSNDAAMFVRIGLLIFIICYGSSSLENTINAVRLGMRAEFVSHLAYHDGLTSIGNRTAFEEYLASLEKEKSQLEMIGIVMFDVNDLKFVNDHLGHQFGDKMLVKSAELIRESFEPVNGACFRIGGDEFAVLLSGEELIKRYEQGLAAFEQGVKDFNLQPEKEFRISIACGFATYSKDSPEARIKNIYQQADMKMYENKKEMKAKQVKPEEYYKGLV